jgi:hypothetical protein
VHSQDRYALPLLQQLRFLLQRQKTIFLRDPTLVRARLMQCILMGLIIGGLWFNLDVTLADAR